MKLRQRLSAAYDAFRRTPKNVVAQERTGVLRVNPLCSSYENVFGQVRVLIDELKSVRPYGVTARGKRLPLAATPELAMLDCPNEDMGWSDFADAMFAMWLTEEELNIHVWKNKNGTIAGYTILPVGSRRYDPITREDYFMVAGVSGSLEKIGRDEVMTLRYSRSPRDLDKGVSPATAGEAAAQLQDVLFQYQKAWFENGAVPASITWITARSRADFEKKKESYERELHGAKNKNKTVFLFRSALDTGEVADEIEVKPIQANNSTMAIREINQIVTGELNRLFGVSPFLMGDDSSAKYDNAELSDLLFTKRRVAPALASFYSQLQHELDRIFNGLGYGINYDLEVPELTDRLKVKEETEKIKLEQQKVKEETKQIQANVLQALINNGATADSAVTALGLGNEWRGVATDLATSRDTQGIQEAELAEQPINFGQSSDILPTVDSKTSDNLRTIFGHDCECHHTMDAPDGFYDPDFSTDEAREQAIYDQLQKLLENAISEALDEGATLSKQDVEKLKDAIQTELLAEADEGANDAAKSIEGFVLGATAEEIEGVLEDGGFHMTEDFAKRLEERTSTLVNRFREHAKKVVAEALNPLREQALSASQIKAELKKVMPKARAATIARNETVYAFRAGTLENAKYLGDQYGLKLRKIWRCHHDSRTCPICEAMDGQVVDVTSAFPDGAQGADGIRYSFEQNSWNDDGQIPSAHVNCRCWFELEVVND